MTTEGLERPMCVGISATEAVKGSDAVQWPGLRLHGVLVGLVLIGLTLSACTATEGSAGDGSPTEDRLAQLGLVGSPPANLIEACQAVARQTGLEAVYCPAVVPKGPVDAPAHGRVENALVAGGKRYYMLSLQSESLVDPEKAADYDADGPFSYFPGRPRGRDFAWHPFEAKHWVVAAERPAWRLRRAVDNRFGFPDRKYKTAARQFTVKGVTATVLTGDIAGYWFASRNHVIVYWQIENIGYLVSVHYDDKAPVAEEIARGLISQMVDCAPHSTGRESQVCNWVFSGS